jgi:hypothetical protein
MMDTELGITSAHPFQLGAVLALAYNSFPVADDEGALRR